MRFRGSFRSLSVLTVLSGNRLDVQHDNRDVAYSESVGYKLSNTGRAYKGVSSRRMRYSRPRTSGDHDELVTPIKARRAEEEVALVAIQARVPFEEPWRSMCS